MNLCLSLFRERLGASVLACQLWQQNDPFDLCRFELYRPGASLPSGILTIARSEDLPQDVCTAEGAALLCIGLSEIVWQNAPIRLLAVDAQLDLAELLNQVGRIFSEFAQLAQGLQDCVNRSSGIQSMVELVAPYFAPNEVRVVDHNYRIIGESASPSHYHVISGLPQANPDGSLPLQLMNFFKNDPVFCQARVNHDPFLYEGEIFAKPCLCMNVFHQGEYACRIIVAEDSAPAHSYDGGLLRMFAGYVQLAFDLSVSTEVFSPGNSAAELFGQLLGGTPVEESRLLLSAGRRGWQVPGLYLCASILPSERDYYNRTLTYSCRIINRDFAGCCAFEYNDAIVCVVDLSSYDHSAARFLSDHVETLRDGYLRVGFSNPFSELSKLRSYYHQADVALKVGMERMPSLWYHHFSDYVLDYMAKCLSADLDRRCLCAPEILTLLRYDRAHQTDFLHTLQVYLNNQLNANQTARDLFVHRATMVYRLDRIVELTGMDFHNADQILYLQISLRMLLSEQDLAVPPILSRLEAGRGDSGN